MGKVVGVVTELVETVSSEQSKRHKAEAQAQSLANDVEIMGGELDEIGKQRARNLRDETMATSRRDAAKLDLNNSSEFPEDGHLRRAKTKEVYEFLQEKCLPAKGHGGTMTASVSKAIAIIQGLVTTIIEAVGKDVIDVTRLMPTKDQERIETTELLIERIKSALHANRKSMSEEERQNIHVLLTYCAPEQVASGDQQGQAHKIANLLQVSEKPNSIWKQSIARRAEFDAAAAKDPRRCRLMTWLIATAMDLEQSYVSRSLVKPPSTSETLNEHSNHLVSLESHCNRIPSLIFDCCRPWSWRCTCETPTCFIQTNISADPK